MHQEVVRSMNRHALRWVSAIFCCSALWLPGVVEAAASTAVGGASAPFGQLAGVSRHQPQPTVATEQARWQEIRAARRPSRIVALCEAFANEFPHSSLRGDVLKLGDGAARALSVQYDVGLSGDLFEAGGEDPVLASRLAEAAQGLTCTTAVHICYGYGIQANVDWKQTLGDEWRQYEQIFPALAKSSIQQVSLECYHSHVPPHLMKLLEGKDVLVGVIDVASDVIETPEQVADTIGTALQFVPKHRLFACTNCGLAPMSREVAEAKLLALAQGAALARQRYGA